MEGKQRAEGERGARKRPRIMAEEMEAQAEEMERRWKEDSRLQLGAEVVRVIWQLSDCLASIMDELVGSWEVMVEESRLLCQLLICNLRCIDLTLGKDCISLIFWGSGQS